MTEPRGYLRYYVKELWHASYTALEIVDVLVVVGIILIGVLSYLGVHLEYLHGHPPWWLIGGAALALIVAYAFFRAPYKLYVQLNQQIETLNRRLTSDLIPLEATIARTRVGDARVPAAYVRLPIRNQGDDTARKCSAVLSNVEVLNSARTKEVPFQDSLEIGWSNKIPGTRQIDIAPSLTEWLDLVYLVKGNPGLLLATIVQPVAYEKLMEHSGTYRFTVVFSCEGRAAQTYRFDVWYTAETETLSAGWSTSILLFEE